MTPKRRQYDQEITSSNQPLIYGKIISKKYQMMTSAMTSHSDQRRKRNSHKEVTDEKKHRRVILKVKRCTDSVSSINNCSPTTSSNAREH